MLSDRTSGSGACLLKVERVYKAFGMCICERRSVDVVFDMISYSKLSNT